MKSFKTVMILMHPEDESMIKEDEIKIRRVEENMAVVEFTLGQKMNQDETLKTLTHLLTRWINTTKAGEYAWEEFDYDYTIEDLILNHIDLFRKWLHKKSKKIFDIRPLSCFSDIVVAPLDPVLIE